MRDSAPAHRGHPEDARIQPFTSFNQSCASDLTGTSTFSPEDWISGSGPVAVHEGPLGNQVEVWSAAECCPSYEVVYRFGRWTVVAHAEIEDAQACARGLAGKESPEGWLLLEAAPPVELAAPGDHAGPELMFSRINGDPDQVLELFAGACAYGDNEDDNYCGGDGLINVQVDGGKGFAHRVYRDLDIRGVHLGS